MAATLRAIAQPKPTPAPNFDREVLEPLRIAQAKEAEAKAEQARLAALEAVRQAAIAQAEQVATQQAASVPAASPAPTTSVSGSCADWLAGAGIADTSDAMYLIGRESGCNARAVNPSSGACGAAQELPCGKSGCVLGDGACQIRWMNSYVLGRYGSWANAVAHENAVSWY